jgi:hypothetical protein
MIKISQYSAYRDAFVTNKSVSIDKPPISLDMVPFRLTPLSLRKSLHPGLVNRQHKIVATWHSQSQHKSVSGAHQVWNCCWTHCDRCCTLCYVYRTRGTASYNAKPPSETKAPATSQGSRTTRLVRIECHDQTSQPSCLGNEYRLIESIMRTFEHDIVEQQRSSPSSQKSFVSRCVERMASNQTYEHITRKDKNK